ncbi:DMT family transporter [uncultured Albimonas sp.]|uniref:DMT family transporter n=1 Tax=uncultured Albimonas sp. TaxID=1331701 RepID=UPI0030EE59DA
MPQAPFDPREIAPAPPVGEASPAETAAPPRPDNALGGAWMLMSVVTASAMVLAVRGMAEGLDSRMTVLLRSLGIMACVGAMLLSPRFRRSLRFSNPRLHLVRGGLIAVSTQFGFYAISNLNLSTATVLSFTAPIFATLLAVPLNGERVGPRRWAAVAAGFAGALIILRPTPAGLDWAMLSALLAAVLFALALALSRGIAAADGPSAAFVSANGLMLLIALPIALPVWELPTGAGGWSLLALLVATSAARNVGDLQAYRHGDASVMGVITYGRLVLIAAAAWAIFDEVPDTPTLVGGGVIIASTLYIAYRERAVARERRALAAARDES